MKRFALLALALVGLAACAPPYRSAIDMAPFEARSSHPLIQSGRYCICGFVMGQAKISAGDNCGDIIWNSATRTYSEVHKDMADPSAPGGPSDAAASAPSILAVVELEPGLILFQSDDDNQTAPHTLSLYLVHGGVVAPLLTWGGAWTPDMMARHPKVTFGRGGQDGKEIHIVTGARSDIAALLRDTAVAELRQNMAQGEKLYFMARDDAPAGDHEPDPSQWNDIEAIRSAIRSLLQSAPPNPPGRGGDL
jgi:hypothetical protein